MKKTVIIILVNLFLIFFVLFLYEFGYAYISFNYHKNNNDSFLFKLQKTIKNSKLHYQSLRKYNYKLFVRPIKMEYDLSKPPIILMGCSFTYGDGLTNEEAFHSVLSNYTKRNVINLGICCTSPRDALFILRDKNTKEELLNNLNQADYVIYTYITSHKKRLYNSVCQYRLNPNFIHDKNYTCLKYKKQNIIMSASFGKNLMTAFFYDKYYHPLKEDSKLLFLYFKEINKEVKKNFSNSRGEKTKFVILVYEDDDKENWKELEQEGVIILNANKITKVNLMENMYRLPDRHPNAKAWEVIVPALAKELNL